MTKKKTKAKRVAKRLTARDIAAQKLDTVADRMLTLQAEFQKHQDWCHAYLRTIEHKLSLDEASRGDMRALREALTDTRRELEYRRAFPR